ncbi:unnamed protein product [Ophioblennius macclurei]
MSSSFEDLLEQVGSFGRFQKRVSGLLCLISLPFAAVYLGVVFQGFTPPHRCRDTAAVQRANDCGWNPEESRRVAPPPVDESGEPSGCRRYDMDWDQVDCDLPQLDLDLNWTKTPTAACQEGWDYEYQDRKSIVTEFDLVCSDSWLVDLFQAVLSVGFLMSSFAFGYLADRFGRRICIFVSNAIAVVSSVVVAVATDYPTILVFRSLLGFSAKGGWMTAYVLMAEMAVVSYRRTVGIIYQTFYSVGVLVLALLAFLIPDWRWLHVATMAPYAFFLLYYWWIPESPRWLISQNRLSEAMKVTESMAAENQRKLSSTLQIVSPDEVESSSGSLLDLIRTSNMRRNTFVLMFNWFASAVVYQGLVMRVGITQGNLYLDFFISGLVEFPATLLVLVTIDRVGRRLPFATANMVAGASCFVTAFIPDSLLWFKTAVACVGRLGITMAFIMVMFVNTELYPTYVRNLGVSVCSTMCDVGGVVVPFLLYRLASMWAELPLIVFGAVALLAGGLVLLLPETKGRPLPETLNDVESPDRKRADDDSESQAISCPLSSAPTDQDEAAA